MYPHKTVDQLKAPPYSEISQEGLNQDRATKKVYCQYCKYTIQTNLYGAKCGQCQSFLISIVPSHFNNGELA